MKRSKSYLLGLFIKIEMKFHVSEEKAELELVMTTIQNNVKFFQNGTNQCYLKYNKS